MRVLLVAEGMHELGREATRGEASGHRMPRLRTETGRGALEVLIRRLCPRVGEVDVRSVRDVVVHGRPGRRLFHRALAWLRVAERERFDALVLLVDQDDDPDRRVQLDGAQAYLELRPPRALGVAIRSFDAWMLADTSALAAAFGRPVDTQPAPESIKDPKATFVSIARDAGCVDSVRDLYARVAEAATPEEIERRCPDGFRVFARRVRGLGAGT